jgi:hypothetical protein
MKMSLEMVATNVYENIELSLEKHCVERFMTKMLE